MAEELAESSTADWDAAPVGLVVMADDGLMIRVNATFARWAGRPVAELLGRPFHRMLTSGGRLFHETRAVPALRLAGEVDFAVSLLASDGTERPVLVRAVRDDSAVAVPGRDDGGRSASPSRTDTAAGIDGDHGHPIFRLAVFDATSRVDFERQMVSARAAAEASAARLRASGDAARDFLAAASEEEVARGLIEAIRSATAAKAVLMLRPDAGGPPVLLAGTDLIGSDEPLDDGGLADAERPDVVALRTGQRVVIPTPDAAERFAPALAAAMRATRLRALSAEPLLDDDGAVWAVVVIFFGRVLEFDPPDGEFAAVLGRQARSALRRISLERRLEQSARVDDLTGLVNRRGLDAPLDAAMARVAGAPLAGAGPAGAVSAGDRPGGGVALLFVDLDSFKAVNDSLGHRSGDAVLQEVGQRLTAAVRDGDTVARFGGDEFVIVCEQVDEPGAVGIAQRLLAAVREPLECLDGTGSLTASVGIALVDADADADAVANANADADAPSVSELSADAVVRAADAAMYLSKRRGGDSVTVVRPGADAGLVTPSVTPSDAPPGPLSGGPRT